MATAIRPVDILCRDADGHTVAVEIKRRGGSTASSSSRATWNCSTVIRTITPSPACCRTTDQTAGRTLAEIGASAAWCSTTTNCAAPSNGVPAVLMDRDRRWTSVDRWIYSAAERLVDQVDVVDLGGQRPDHRPRA